MAYQCTYFSLAPSLYAAEYEKTVIILDSINDKYLSLIDQAAVYLNIVLQHSFSRDAFGNYYIHSDDGDQEQLNYWITYFQHNHFIVPSSTPNKNHIASSPIKNGGLCDYQWDMKSSWSPFSRVSMAQIFLALIMLIKVNWIIKRKGIKGLLDFIKKSKLCHKALINPDTHALENLTAAVDSATQIYPKKTFCLAWSATFVVLALKQQWDVRFIVGVQANPFYAHAWAQTSDGTVIHDDAQVRDVLSKIVTLP